MAGDWKKSKGMMIILIVVIAIGVYLTISRKGPKKDLGVVKVTYICAKCGATKEINPPDFDHDGYPPYKCDVCSAIAMWPAYHCTHCKDENGNDLVFPGKVDVKAPVYPGDDASPEELNKYIAQKQRFLTAMMGARCPKCGASAAGGFIVKKVIGPEAQKEIDRMEADFQKRKKK